jgi:hypothetical protein
MISSLIDPEEIFKNLQQLFPVLDEKRLKDNREKIADWFFRFYDHYKSSSQ